MLVKSKRRYVLVWFSSQKKLNGPISSSYWYTVCDRIRWESPSFEPLTYRSCAFAHENRAFGMARHRSSPRFAKSSLHRKYNKLCCLLCITIWLSKIRMNNQSAHTSLVWCMANTTASLCSACRSRYSHLDIKQGVAKSVGGTSTKMFIIMFVVINIMWERW